MKGQIEVVILERNNEGKNRNRYKKKPQLIKRQVENDLGRNEKFPAIRDK